MKNLRAGDSVSRATRMVGRCSCRSTPAGSAVQPTHLCPQAGKFGGDDVRSRVRQVRCSVTEEGEHGAISLSPERVNRGRRSSSVRDAPQRPTFIFAVRRTPTCRGPPRGVTGFRRMSLLWVVVGAMIAASLEPSPLNAQVIGYQIAPFQGGGMRRTTPSETYYTRFRILYDGDYVEALRGFSWIPARRSRPLSRVGSTRSATKRCAASVISKWGDSRMPWSTTPQP